MLLLSGWGAVRTLPFLARYGSDALRDAVLWGYCAFAIIFIIIIRIYPATLIVLLQKYKGFCTVFPYFALAELIGLYVGVTLPRWLSPTPFLSKPGDLGVHLAGVLAFWTTCSATRVRWIPAATFGAACTLAAILNRGAGLSLFSAGLALVLLGFSSRLRSFMASAITGVAVALFIGIFLPKAVSRQLSAEQLATNYISVLQPTSSGALVGSLRDTANWREQWWATVIQYTFTRKHGVWGKGFGINLADDDGFQVVGKGFSPLRSPHNGHITMLARAGVPGFVLWVLLQGSWAYLILHSAKQAGRSGQSAWSRCFRFLFVYWLSFIVNASFDVFLEGPMGGVWFWCVFGIGLGAAYLHARLVHIPQALPSPSCPSLLA
jgi:hypothetical protein